MWRFSLPSTLLPIAVALTACGDGSATPKVVRSIDASALTFADVQARARDAATTPGVIFHNTNTEDSDRFEDAVSEAWLDFDRHVARIDRNGEVYQIFDADKLVMLSPFDGRYQESQYEFEGTDEPLIPFTLDYLERLTDQRIEGKGIDEAVVDGVAAIRVRMQRETNSDGVRGTEHATVYLDESFLPLRMEIDPGTGDEYRTTRTYRNEYLERDAVAADFFSFDQVRAIAKTASDNLRDAAKPFGTAYWFGERFEGMIAERVAGFAPEGGEPWLNIGYGAENAGAGGPDAPFPCARLTQYTIRGWGEHRKRVAQNNPDAARRVERDIRSVLDGEAHIFEQPADRIFEQPRIEGQPAPTPPTLVDSSGWSAEVTFSASVVELSVYCGPPGKNPYRSLEGVRHLLDALQPFDAR